MPIPLVTDLDQTPGPLIYARALSADDRRKGRICTQTGFWAPGHCLVYVDGAPYIKGWEPSASAGRAAGLIAEFRKNLRDPQGTG